MKRLLLLSVAVISLVSCRDVHNGKISLSQDAIHDTLIYARNLTIKHCEGYIKVDLRNPWDTLQLLTTYLLVDRNSPLPTDLPKGEIIKVPIKNIISYTYVHSSVIEELGAADDIVGVCEPQYIISPKVRARVDAGEIADLGQATSPNIEKIIACGGEIIIASPYENVGFGVVQKIGIPIIQASDYMERDPLGRTEWIRFYGLLLRKEAMADSIFLSTANSYNSLKELSKSSPTRPKLLTERKYGSTWFLPGAKSYMVRMYSDAGAEYIFNDISSEGSVPMSFETVLDRAMHADVWVMKYDMDRAMRYQDLLAENPLYAEFDPFKNHNVYTCNTVTTQYYGDIMLHPDYILADLVYIFHPELLEGHQLRYYQKMAE